jgi:hypothetical protein
MYALYFFYFEYKSFLSEKSLFTWMLRHKDDDVILLASKITIYLET